jgi:glucose-6-phosphate isomerase
MLKEQPTSVISFIKTKAYEKLKKLAEHPFDLSKQGNLTSDRIERFTAEAAGYKMFYGTERIDNQTMSALEELARESQIVAKMHAMQNGDVINLIEGYPSENRSVLHTATRDFFENPQQTKIAKEAADTARKELERLKTFMNGLDKRQLSDLIVIGIGGSELGPKAHYEALLPYLKPGRQVHFVGNIDPDSLGMVLKKVDLAKTLGLVISKTGSTLETTVNEELLRNQFKKAGLKPEEHLIAVTAKGSPLDDHKKYLEVFNLWDWVGGRFSTTSMVGGVLLTFAYGFDVFWELLRGANAMDKVALSFSMDNNLPLLAALLGIWNRNFLHHELVAIIPYSSALARYPSHIQQLDMESNGKHIDKEGHFVQFETGPYIFGEPGTNAQHSFFQLIHQGTTPCPLEFIGYLSPQLPGDEKYNNTTSQEKLLSNMLAQAISLATGQHSDNPNKDFKGNRPSFILLGKKLTPFALGALLAFYEHKIAFQGFIWNINSFDQEGVALGKMIATKIISRIAARGNAPTGPDQAFSLGDTYLKLLNQFKGE